MLGGPSCGGKRRVRSAASRSTELPSSDMRIACEEKEGVCVGRWVGGVEEGAARERGVEGVRGAGKSATRNAASNAKGNAQAKAMHHRQCLTGNVPQAMCHR